MSMTDDDQAQTHICTVPLLPWIPFWGQIYPIIKCSEHQHNNNILSAKTSSLKHTNDGVSVVVFRINVSGVQTQAYMSAHTHTHTHTHTHSSVCRLLRRLSKSGIQSKA